MQKITLGQVFLQVLPFSAVNNPTNAPLSSSSPFCSYQKEVWAKRGSLQQAVFFWKPRSIG